jgi:hypothetical protein
MWQAAPDSNQPEPTGIDRAEKMHEQGIFGRAY